MHAMESFNLQQGQAAIGFPGYKFVRIMPVSLSQCIISVPAHPVVFFLRYPLIMKIPFFALSTVVASLAALIG